MPRRVAGRNGVAGSTWLLLIGLAVGLVAIGIYLWAACEVGTFC